MAILPIYTYDQPVLKKKTEPVEELNEEVQGLIDNMFETMHNASGVGLAANQVGVSKAITVIDLSDADEEDKAAPLALINPVIEHFSDYEEEFEEGCLSLPDFREMVIRPSGIQVRFFDREMKEQRMETDGLLARVMQHEIDHLNGIYFFERLTPIRKAKAHHILKRIQRGQIPTDYPIKPYRAAAGHRHKR